MQWLGVVMIALVVKLSFFEIYQIVYGYKYVTDCINTGNYYEGINRKSIIHGFIISFCSIFIEIIELIMYTNVNIFIIVLIIQISIAVMFLVAYMWIKKYNRNMLNLTSIGILISYGIIMDKMFDENYSNYYHMFVITIVVGVCFCLLYIHILYRIPDSEYINNQAERMGRLVNEISEAAEDENKRKKILDEFHKKSYKELSEIKLHIENNDIDLIDKMIDDSIEKIRQKKFSENAVVNIILERMERKCNEQGINFSIKMDDLLSLNLDELILSSILNNLLDNAYNYCSLFPEKEDRYIDVAMSRKGDYISFLVKNAYYGIDNKRKKIQNNSESTFDKKHGYGLIILEDIAKNHNGKYKKEIKKNTYTAFVVIME